MSALYPFFFTHVLKLPSLPSSTLPPTTHPFALPPHPQQNNSEAALAAFKVAARKFHNGRKNHAPLLAQASVHFNNGNIAEAHHL